MQQVNLFKAEGVELKFEHDAIKKMAQFAYELNQNTENTGVRRLHTIVEKVVEDISFNAEDYKGQTIVIN